MNVADNPETTLQLRHTYAAPRERVFDAWLDPATMRRFLGPEDYPLLSVESDARVGGWYRIVMKTSDGPYTAAGTYTQIRRPEHLSFTWVWEEDDPELDFESEVVLDFYVVDGGTELVLTHRQLRDARSRDRHAEGWAPVLRKLEAVLAPA